MISTGVSVLGTRVAPRASQSSFTSRNCGPARLRALDFRGLSRLCKDSFHAHHDSV